MKLLELEVEGYRSLMKITWTPGDLNVLIGPNGSGKTNLLRVLELLSASARGGLAQHVKGEGGIWSMTSAGGLFVPIRIFIKTSPPAPFLLPSLVSGYRRPDSLTYGIKVSGYRRGHGFTGNCAVEEEILEHHYAKSDDSSEPATTVLLNATHAEAKMLDEKTNEMVDAKQLVPNEETLLSVTRPPFPINTQIADYQDALSEWTVYQDLWPRVYSARPFAEGLSSIRFPTMSRYDSLLEAHGGNLLNFLHTLYSSNREFEAKINEAMRAAFGEEFEKLSFPPAGDQLIQLQILWKSLRRAISASDLSDGTLRFLFLIAALANPAPPPLIAIEEPEIGLHPSMLPIIVEYAVDAASRTQVIFTTHSPDFLSAFRDTVPTTTVFNWEDGQTALRVLKDEDLKYWLKEYTLGQFAFSGAAEAVE